MSRDPVRYCNLYKQKGCSHVDGFLCDFNTCSMRIDYDNIDLLTVCGKFNSEDCVSSIELSNLLNLKGENEE
jgi:hypothetical protein